MTPLGPSVRTIAKLAGGGCEAKFLPDPRAPRALHMEGLGFGDLNQYLWTIWEYL